MIDVTQTMDLYGGGLSSNCAMPVIPLRKRRLRHASYITAPVQNNQLGTEFGSRGMWWVPTVTSLDGLLAPHISARDIRLILKYSSQEIHDHHGLLA